MDIYIIDNFEANKLSLAVPSFYKIVKNETIVSYLLLKYAYFKAFNKELNINHILKDKNGKPYLKNKEIFFNISHSKNYVCCGISKFEIGIDIEENRKINKASIKKILTEDEYQIPDIKIIEYWVIKEAYSKYLGLGLKLNFSDISVKNIEKLTNLSKIENKNFICYAVGKEDVTNVTILNKKIFF